MFDKAQYNEYLKIDKMLEKRTDRPNYMIPLIFDRTANSFFKNQPKFLKKFLKEQFKNRPDIDFSTKENIFFCSNKLPTLNFTTHQNKLDMVVYIGDKILLNLEFNTEVYSSVGGRNYIYLLSLISSTFKVGDKSQNIKEKSVIQLNINGNKSDKNYGEKSYNLKETLDENISKTLGNYKIINLNIAYYYDLYYNKGEKLDKKELWLLAMTTRKFSELYTLLCMILDNEEEIDIFMEEMIKLNDNKMIYTTHESSVLDEIGRQMALSGALEEGISQGISQGINQGINQGKKEEKIKIAKKLLSMGISQKEVSEATGLSIKKIESLLEK